MWAHVHYQQDGAGARPGLVRERAGRPPADAAGRCSATKARRKLGLGAELTAEATRSTDLSVLAECRTLVDGGLVNPAESLAMATRNGAWALGFDQRSGTLAPGMSADLVILRPAGGIADPHEAAIDPATQIIATLRRGRVIA